MIIIKVLTKDVLGEFIFKSRKSKFKSRRPLTIADKTSL